MSNHQYFKDLKKAGLLKNISISSPKRGGNNKRPITIQKLPTQISQNCYDREDIPKVSFDINSFFDKIYVLNLDHRTDRMSLMKKRLQMELPITVGSQLSMDIINHTLIIGEI